MAEVNGAHRDELIRVIREVRTRWRNKLMLRGAVAIVAGALLALLLASLGLQTLKFSASSIIGFRLAILLVFAALVLMWFVRPLRRRVSDTQVALYVEEFDPSLEAAILSAVEVGAAGARADHEVSPVIVERLVAQAIEKSRSLDGGKAIGRQDIRRAAIALTSVCAATLLLLVVGPEFLRQGASALLVLSRSVDAASPYSISVSPGNVTVPKGSD